MSVLSSLGNVALVGGAAVAGVALGGDHLAEWMAENAGEDPSKFWTGTADFFKNAHDGINSAAQHVLPESMDQHADTIVAATAAAVAGGLKFASAHADHDDVAQNPTPGTLPGAPNQGGPGLNG